MNDPAYAASLWLLQSRYLFELGTILYNEVEANGEIKEKSMRRVVIVFIVFLTLLILASCTGNSVTPTATAEPVKLVVPTPGVDTAVVTGKILSTETRKPPEAILFLSKNITVGRTDIPAVLSFSYQSSPRGYMDTEGNFYFQDVPEGTYAITLWTPPDNAFFIPDDSGQDYKWVLVTSGQLIELGDIKAP